MKLFTIASPLFMAMDDEMPAAPAGGAAAAVGTGAEKSFSGEVDAESYEKTPEMGEPLPAATYHFRLDSYREGWNDPPKPEDKEYAYGAQPYFMLKWIAQQEPVVGRVFSEFVPWVNDEVVKAATSGDSNARAVITDRIWKAKSIASAAGFKPAPGQGFNAKTFFSTNPEIKISLSVDAKKKKDNDPTSKTFGSYVTTDQKGNKAVAYLPLFGEPRK